MNWTITVKPSNSALDEWSWTAVRDDQENTLRGTGYRTGEDAHEVAKLAIQEFEDTQGVIKAATKVHTFSPTLPDIPQVPDVPEIHLP